MKTRTFAIYLIGIVSLCSLASCGSAGELSALSQYENVEVVHLPKAATFMASTFIDDDDFAKSLIKKAGSLDIVSCSGEKNRDKVLEVITKSISENGSELVLDVNNERESVRIYGKIDQTKNRIPKIMIVSESNNDISIVRMNGSMNLDALVNATLDDNNESGQISLF